MEREGKKERSMVRSLEMDNFKSLLGIRRIDGMPNARVRDFCGVKKEVDERSDETVLRWF